MGVAVDQAKDLVNAVQSLTVSVPDYVRAQGDTAEALYRTAIANGLEGEKLENFANSQEFVEAVKQRGQYEAAVEHYGTESEIPLQVAMGIIAGEKFLFEDGVVYNVTKCNSAVASLGVCAEVFGVDSGTITSEEIKAIIAENNAKYEDALANGNIAAITYLAEKAKLAADCSALWYQELRKREGDEKALKQYAEDIKSDEFKKMLEVSGKDPIEFMVEAGVKVEVEIDQKVIDKFKNDLNTSSSREEALKMLENYSTEELLQVGYNYLNFASEKNVSQADINFYKKIYGVLFDAINTKVTYPEENYLQNYLPITLYDSVIDDKINAQDTINIVSSLYGISGLNINLVDDPNIVGIPNDAIAYLHFGGEYIPYNSQNQTLNDINVGPSDVGVSVLSNTNPIGTVSIVLHPDAVSSIANDNNQTYTQALNSIVVHEMVHARQYQDMINLINYGIDINGQASSNCISTPQCQATLFQYMGAMTNSLTNAPDNSPSEYILREVVNNSQQPLTIPW